MIHSLFSLDNSANSELSALLTVVPTLLLLVSSWYNLDLLYPIDQLEKEDKQTNKLLKAVLKELQMQNPSHAQQEVLEALNSTRTRHVQLEVPAAV